MIVPQGKIALGKLAQALVHGAQVVQVDGSFDDALEICRKLAVEYPVELVNSVNPYRIEGQKTGAFEICDYLGRAPDLHVIPVGNAGNITAYWLGYREYQRDGIIATLPVMRGYQAAGAAPIVLGHPVDKPSDDRDRDPHRPSRLVGQRRRGGGPVRRLDPRRHRP